MCGTAARVNCIAMMLIFAKIGALAFGGGSAMLSMLHTEFCVRRKLITDQQFQVLYGMARMLPGINLLSLTVLLGYHCHGVWGSFLALVGLTVPSFILIVLACLLLEDEKKNSNLEAALRGLMPATAALLLFTTGQLCIRMLQAEAFWFRILWLSVIAGTVILVAWSVIPPAAVILLAGGLGILLNRRLTGTK